MRLTLLICAIACAAASNEAGKKFLEANKAKEGVVTTKSGLQYKVIKAAKDGAPKPKADTPCKCHYKGTLIDGTEFDSSYKRGEPTTFAPNQVIKGWTEAMQLMGQGAKWELYIPSELAYGDSNRGQHIKAGDVLVFELEIIEVLSDEDDDEDEEDEEPKKPEAKKEKKAPKKKKEEPDHVVHLTDADFSSKVFGSKHNWLVEFYAPWCGHCKNLAPEWKKAAAQLKDFEYKGRTVKLGALDATAHKEAATPFKVTGFPTIKFLPSGSKSAEDAQDYGAGRTASDIVTFAKEACKPKLNALKLAQLVDEAGFKACTGARPLEEDKEEGEQMDKQGALEGVSGNWCVIAFLPALYEDSKANRDAALASLETLYNTHRAGHLTMVWSEAGAQPSLEGALRKATDRDLVFPSIAAVNLEKGKERAVIHVGKGITPKEIDQHFLPSLRRGWAKSSAFDSSVKVETVAAWDGEEFKDDYEEEFSLEEIMGME